MVISINLLNLEPSLMIKQKMSSSNSWETSLTVKRKMPPKNFSETTQALVFEAEYDNTLNPLFFPDEEMHEDEDNVNTMLVPLDPPSAISPQGRNQDRTIPTNYSLILYQTILGEREWIDCILNLADCILNLALPDQ